MKICRHDFKQSQTVRVIKKSLYLSQYDVNCKKTYKSSEDSMTQFISVKMIEFCRSYLGAQCFYLECAQTARTN